MDSHQKKTRERGVGTELFLLNPPPLSVIKTTLFWGGTIIYKKIKKNWPRGFYYLQNLPPKSTQFWDVLGGFPLNNKQKPQKFSRASRAGVKRFSIFFRGGTIIYKIFLPRFARGFYYLQNLQKSARGFG